MARIWFGLPCVLPVGAVPHVPDSSGVWNTFARSDLCSVINAFFNQGSLSMKKVIFVGLAILAVSTSGALAKKAAKPKDPAAATTMNTGGQSPPMFGQVSAADRELYKKNQRDAGIKAKAK
jgi:hypothetical protein